MGLAGFRLSSHVLVSLETRSFFISSGEGRKLIYFATSPNESYVAMLNLKRKKKNPKIR